MSQSLSQIYVHIVFSTKHRERTIQGEDLQTKLHAYLLGACRNLNSPSIAIGGVEDHVHILCRQAKTITVSDLVRELKRESSKWIKEQGVPSFYWQQGYGAFSISPSHVDPVVEYIRNQKAHHQTVSFQDEFRKLCRKYGLDLDERYCWE